MEKEDENRQRKATKVKLLKAYKLIFRQKPARK
jgi:hypothetical protein